MIVTLQEIQTWIEIQAPVISLIEWAGTSSKKSKWFNSATNREIFCSFSELKKKIKRHDINKIGANHWFKDNAEIWLQKNAPYIKLINWAGSANKKSLFFIEGILKEILVTTMIFLKFGIAVKQNR